jgi:uncharacterized surface protein with fasciclin (FAS1) repeats
MKRSTRFRAFVAALTAGALGVSAIGGAALARDAGSSAAEGNIVETAVAAGKFDTLVSLVEEAGLAETLASVPKKTLAALQANPSKLKAVLLYHVVKGELRANRVTKRSSIETLNGASVTVKVTRGVVKINNARVIQPNVDATNGVIHVINRVLVP